MKYNSTLNCVRSLLFTVVAYCACGNIKAQTTVFFQGFENAALTCAENWGYTGGVRNSETAKTGTFSGRVGRSAESNTITFNTVNIASLAGVNLQVSHSVRSGSGPGMDTREGAVIQVSLNGGAWTAIGRVGGFGDVNWAWTASPGGSASASAGCTVYQCVNPLNYSVPAGTTTIAMRALSVNRNSSTCTNFNTDMTNGTASNYDRTDEGFFIDNVTLTTTSTAIPGIWTGIVSTDWFDCNNWHNRIVPTVNTDVTIDQTAVNSCVVGVSMSGNAVCRDLALSSNSGTTRNLTVQGTTSLACGGNVTVIKTGTNANVKLTLLNSATFSCNNLTLTGTASGQENAQFENEVSATVTATVNGNMTINAGGKLDLTNSPTYGILHIKGNYNNNGLETDFKQTNSYIILDGTGSQNINTNSFTEIFSNLVISKASGTVTLLDNIEVETQLDMQNGPLALNGFTTQIDNNATTGIIRTNGCIISENTANTSRVLWLMGGTTGAHLFPFSTSAGNYIPFTFNVTAGSANNVTLSTYGTPPDNLPWPATPTNVTNLLSTTGLTPDNRDATVDRFWEITVTGSPTATLTFSYAASELPVAPYNNANTMVAQRYDSGTNFWAAALPGQSASAYAVTVPGVTTFSPWTLTSTLSPLPVELLWFRGIRTGDAVALSWETASEVNNDYFSIEHATDHTPFTSIGTVDGNGTTTQPQAYLFLDENPATGANYYRLKQTDFNGQYEYSGIVSINFEGGLTATGSANAWSCAEGLCYTVNGWDETVSITVYDITGRKIASRRVAADETGFIPVADAAIYMIRFETSRQTEVSKVLRGQ